MLTAPAVYNQICAHSTESLCKRTPEASTSAGDQRHLARERLAVGHLAPRAVELRRAQKPPDPRAPRPTSDGLARGRLRSAAGAAAAGVAVTLPRRGVTEIASSPSLCFTLYERVLTAES